MDKEETFSMKDEKNFKSSTTTFFFVLLKIPDLTQVLEELKLPNSTYQGVELLVDNGKRIHLHSADV